MREYREKISRFVDKAFSWPKKLWHGPPLVLSINPEILKEINTYPRRQINVYEWEECVDQICRTWYTIAVSYQHGSITWVVRKWEDGALQTE